MNPLDGLRDVVAPALLKRASKVSGRLNDLGVPHTLIGGLAVGVHGHPRATNASTSSWARKPSNA